LILASVVFSLGWTAFAQSTPAQPNRWTSVGPGRGFNTTAIAVDPDTSTTIFIGTDKGEILRSGDGGGSWTSVHLEAGSFIVSAIAISPAPASTVYAVFTTTTPPTFAGPMLLSRSRVLRSLDGGDTWGPAINGLRNLGVQAIVVDPFDPFRVYAGAIGGVFRSDDRGRTWSDVSEGLTDRNIQALVADPAAPGTLFAGAAHMFLDQSGGLFRTTDGGVHWSEISESLPPPGQTVLQVRALAAAASPRTLYASVLRLTLNLGAYYGEEAVLKSTDGGNTWSSAGLQVSGGIVSLTVDPAMPSTVYASEFGGFLRKTVDGGASWSLMLAAAGQPLVIDPHAHNTIYARSVSDTALLAKSENGAESWTDLANGLRSPSVSSVATDSRLPTTVYCGTSANGVFKSTDGGATWRAANAGLGDLQIVSLTNVPWPSPVLFAATGSKQIYRSADGAETWTPASGGLPPQSGRLGSVLALAADPSSPGTAYAAVYGFGVFKTTNRGDAWTPSNDGMNLDVRALAVDPRREGVVYAATGAGVFKSTTAGSVWAASSNGLGPRIAYLLAIDPLDSSVVYVATNHLEPYRGGPAQFEAYDVVFRSVDGGASWTSLSSVTYATRFATIDGASGALYLSTFDGVIRSLNRGLSWEALKEGLPSGYFSLALAPGMPPTLYAANERDIPGGGLFRLTLGAPRGLCVPSATALCLNRGRFRVEASFNARNIAIDGAAPTVSLTDEAGGFWFFSPQNVEVVVKVVDGTSFNGRFWVFAAGLSNVEYTLTVTDTAEGLVKTYFNPSGSLESLADAAAFPSGLAAASPTSTPIATSNLERPPSALCEQDPSVLCLNGGRFRVTATFRVPSQGQDETASAVSLTTDTGYFWFFSPGNIELVVKVLDGRVVNGKFWVFYGRLTDVESTITVTDTLTGHTRTYFNPAGSVVSEADTAAF
jgi:photosystem II stability/assembly factor-like uncharacterized protein